MCRIANIMPELWGRESSDLEVWNFFFSFSNDYWPKNGVWVFLYTWPEWCYEVRIARVIIGMWRELMGCLIIRSDVELRCDGLLNGESIIMYYRIRNFELHRLNRASKIITFFFHFRTARRASVFSLFHKMYPPEKSTASYPLEKKKTMIIPLSVRSSHCPKSL